MRQSEQRASTWRMQQLGVLGANNGSPFSTLLRAGMACRTLTASNVVPNGSMSGEEHRRRSVNRMPRLSRKRRKKKRLEWPSTGLATERRTPGRLLCGIAFVATESVGPALSRIRMRLEQCCVRKMPGAPTAEHYWPHITSTIRPRFAGVELMTWKTCNFFARLAT